MKKKEGLRNIRKTEHYKIRPTYQLVIVNNATGETEIDEEIISIVGTIRTGRKTEDGKLIGAALSWGVDEGEVDRSLIDLMMSAHTLIMERDMRETLGSMFAAKK